MVRYANFNLSRRVAEALNTFQPKEFLGYSQNRVQGQGLQLKTAVYYIYNYMQSVASGEPFRAQNWVLTAPSGSGKTEFYRAVKDFCEIHNIPIPVVQIDLSQITEEGYKGSNPSTIPKRILADAPSSNGIGICFLDEADKKCVPSYSSGGIDINAAVQSNLLTLIEGIKLKVDTDDSVEDFDSNLTMFVLMGAFQDVRHKKSHKERSLGFLSELDGNDRNTTEKTADSFYDDLTIQDMIDFGMQEELAGRLVQVVNFHKLSKKAMRKLIRCKVNEISNEIGINIEITKAAESAFLDIAFGSLGVRRPMNLIRELVQNTVAEVFFEKGFDSINEKVVIESPECARIAECSKRSESAPPKTAVQYSYDIPF
ncbi:MAG: AAA family ATPase [Ruminococcus sp.]|nr:AAA family ATPase [Ruminococcus sp.]